MTCQYYAETFHVIKNYDNLFLVYFLLFIEIVLFSSSKCTKMIKYNINMRDTMLFRQLIYYFGISVNFVKSKVLI